jgi:hypothetical protein
VQTALAQAQAMPPPAGDAAPGGGPGPAEHGGAARTAEPLSKHADDETGAMQGSGAQAPIAPGGQVL